jgi:hypothetical protein
MAAIGMTPSILGAEGTIVGRNDCGFSTESLKGLWYTVNRPRRWNAAGEVVFRQCVGFRDQQHSILAKTRIRRDVVDQNIQRMELQ